MTVTTSAALQSRVQQTQLELPGNRVVMKMASRELLRCLRELNLRNNLGGRILTNDELTTGARGYTAPQLIRALRQQLYRLSASRRPDVRARLRYFYQIQMAPAPIRRLMSNYVGMTFLPGADMDSFPEGTDLWNIEHVEVLTLNAHLGVPAHDGLGTIDHFALKIHLLEVDRTSGEIRLGGEELLDGEPISRTPLSRSFTQEPARSHDVVPASRFDIIEAGLCMHEEIEMYAVDGLVRQTAPVLPQLWGSLPADSSLYETPALRRAAYANVIGWLRSGCAHNRWTSEWPEPLCLKLKNINHEMVDDWATIAAHVGEIDARYLIEWCVMRTVVECGDSIVLPLSFLDVSSLPRVKNIFLGLHDFLGRDVPALDGGVIRDPGLSRIQVIHMNALSGRLGGLKYDFSAEME